VSEILHVITFYTICNLSFPLKKLCCSVLSPFVFYQVIFKFLYIQAWYMNKGLDPSYQVQSNIENTYIITTLLIISVGWFFDFYDFWL
jgi:hypothetical protein